MELSEGKIVHSSQGRLRIRINEARRNPDLLNRIKRKLEKMSAIESVHIGEKTGSLLIAGTFIDTEQISKFAEENQLFYLRSGRPLQQSVSRRMIKTFDDWNRTILKSSKGEFDLSFLIFLVLLGIGTYQMTRQRFRLPPWYTAFWYALGLGVITRAISEDSEGND